MTESTWTGARRRTAALRHMLTDRWRDIQRGGDVIPLYTSAETLMLID